MKWNSVEMPTVYFYLFPSKNLVGFSFLWGIGCCHRVNSWNWPSHKEKLVRCEGPKPFPKSVSDALNSAVEYIPYEMEKL